MAAADAGASFFVTGTDTGVGKTLVSCAMLHRLRARGLRALGMKPVAADVAVELALPVVLVVGMRLGCLNHALLTQQAIAARSLRLAGWIANSIDPQMARFDGNLQALRERIAAPLMGVIPYRPMSDAASIELRLPHDV